MYFSLDVLLHFNEAISIYFLYIFLILVVSII